MKQVFLTITLVFILLIIIPFGLTFGIKYLPGAIQPSLGNTKRIYGDFTLSQSFISPKDNLTGIGTSLKNPNFANKEDITLNIYDEEGQLIRRAVLNGKNIEDGEFIKFFFSPITDSKDKKFTYSLLSPSSKYENSLEIFLTEEKPSWSLQFFVNGQVVDENLSYVTLHIVSSPAEILSIVYTNWLGKLIGDSYFLILYTGLLLFIFLLMLSPIARKHP